MRLRLGLLILLLSLTRETFGQTVLNFPRIIATPQAFTSLGVSNPTPREVSVTFTAFQSDGTALSKQGIQNPRTINIPASGHYGKLFTEIFPVTDSFNGWIQATSSASGLTGFFLNSNSASTDIDGAGVNDPVAEFIFPIAAEDAQVKTELTLVNINSEPAAVTLTLYGSDGSVTATKDLTLAGRALIRQTLRPLFNDVSLTGASHVRVRSDRPIGGHEVVADFQIPEIALRRETIALGGHGATPALTTTLSQFVTGGGWSSFLNVVNGSGVGQDVTLTAYKEDGTAWPLPANPKRISLVGNGALKTTVQSLFEFPSNRLNTGWIEIRSSLGFIVSNVGFGNIQTPSFAVVSGLEAAQASRLSVISQVAEGGGFFTGLTVINTGRDSATVDFFILRADGTTVGKTSFTVGPNQRVAKLFRELLQASFDQVGGWAFVRSTQPIVGSGLLGTTNGFALANIPAQTPAAASDFTPPAQTTAAISGAVHQDVVGAGEVTVTLSGPVTTTKTTDASGVFAFTQLPPGQYKVAVSKAGAQFFPSERSVTVARDNIDNVNFDAVGIAPSDAPAISFLTPSSIFGGNTTFNISVLGNNFNQTSVVRINDQALQTNFVNSTELRAAVPTSLLRNPGVLTVTVFTPPPGGGTSTRADLTILALPDNPFVEAHASAGKFPAGVAIHPGRKIALVTSETDDNVSIIDLKTLQTAATVKVGRSPAEGITVYPEKDLALVANVGDGDVHVIDLKTNQVTQKIKVQQFPTGIAINPNTNRAVVVNGLSDNVSIIDLESMTVTGTIPVGKRPSSVAINPRTNLAVVTNKATNDVSIIDLAAGAVAVAVAVGNYPRGVAINPNNNTAVVANANSNSVSILNLATRSVIATINVGTAPTGVAIHLPTNTAVVTNSGMVRPDTPLGPPTSVSIINLDLRQVTQTVPVGSAAFGVDIDPDSQRAVVADYGSNDITIVRLPNPKPVISDIEPKTFPAGGGTFTITVRGTGFLPTSVVTLNGQTLPTTFISPAELQAQVTAAILQQLLQRRNVEAADPSKGARIFEQVTQINFDIGVSNPGPGGGDSPPPANPEITRITPQNAAPVLISIDPTQIELGAGEARVTLSGNNFNATSQVNFGGNAHSPAAVSSTSMTVVIPGNELRAGPAAVSVTNPPPGGGTTAPLTFTVLQNPNPSPAITNVTPAELAAGSNAAAVRITGSGFIASTTVLLQDAPVQATIGSGVIDFTIPANIIQSPGTIRGLVINAAPGGGSSSFNINVLNPAPVVTGFSPNEVSAGSNSLDLRVTGSRFSPTSSITVEGTPVSTQSVNSGELRGTLSAAFLARGGRLKIGVTNPSPGGGSAGAGVLAVTTSKPTLTSITPAKGPVSQRPFTAQLVGSGFVGNSVVTASGTLLASVLDSATLLTVTIPETLMSKAGVLRFSVTNPEPGGGTSNVVEFPVEAGVPRLDSIDPPGARADQAGAVVTLNGSNFGEGATVMLGDDEAPAAFVSATQLRVTLTTPMTLGRFPVKVKIPPPGGGISNAIDFTVTSLVPAIVEIRPASSVSGQTITIAGTNFGRGSRVLIGGVAAVTATVSDTQLTAVVPFEIPAGVAAVVVANPAPGGGNSNEAAIQLSAAIAAITALDPASVKLDQVNPTITVTGRGFANRAVVQVDGVAVTTTFVNETTLKFVLPAIAKAGVVNITVLNPPPGGGVSAPFALTVQNPTPVLRSIAPTTATAGTTLTLIVTGAGFVKESTIAFAGATVQTTFVDSTTLTATIVPTGTGTQSVNVTNPAPGGGTSNSLPFEVTVALNPIPSIANVSPSIVGAGSQATVEILGSGFVSGVSVLLDGSNVSTAVPQSSSSVLVTLPALSAGSHTIVVSNPGPGGGKSNSFTISAISAPMITSLSPSLVASGSSAFTMTIAGANFGTASSAVSIALGSTTLEPLSVSASQISLNVPATAVASEGTLNVVVRVSGVSSNTVLLSVRASDTFATGLKAAYDLVFNAQKELLIANSGTGSILKVSPLGAVSTFATGFTSPVGLAMSISGELYVADGTQGTISKVSSSGSVSSFASGLNHPNDIVLDGAGNLLVANSGDGTIKKITAAGQVSTFCSLGTGAAPFGLAIDASGFVYVSEFNTGYIYRIGSSGSPFSVYAVMNKLSEGLALDSGGRLFIGNGTQSSMDRIDQDGRVAHVSTSVTFGGSVLPTFDSSGVLYVASNDRIVRFASQVSTIPTAAPFVSRMEPAFATAGATVPASIMGSGLSSASAVTFSSNTVTAALQNEAGNAFVPVSVKVAPSAAVSSLTFTVTTSSGPTNSSAFDVVGIPAISAISPTSATAESDDFTLTINGSNLHSDSIVQFGSALLTPASRSATQVRVVIPTSAVFSVGFVDVSVKSAGSNSNALTFNVKTPVTSVTISPLAPTLTSFGATHQFTATAKNADGNVVSGKAFVWTSSSTSVATVDSNGLARSIGNGEVTITAVVDGVSATAALKVDQAVSTITVSPTTAALSSIGATQPFSAELKDANGNVVTNKTVTWSSTSSPVASVDSATGIAVAVGEGTASIKATVGDKFASASLTVAQVVAAIEVTPAAATLESLSLTQPFQATAKDAGGKPIASKTFTWSSDKADIASINAATGVATALADGGPAPITIRAKVDGKEGTATLVVSQKVSTVQVTAGSATLASLNATQQFKAAIKDANNQSVAGKSIGWSSDKPEIASVDNNGLVKAIANGSAVIKATVDGKSGELSVSVDQAVDTITVTPSSKTLTSLNETQEFTVTLKDALNNVVAGKSVTWSSNAADIASVAAASGVATALKDGTAEIKAAVGSKSAAATLTVAQAVASVQISPDAKTFASLQQTATFTVTVKDAKGNNIAGKTVDWTSDSASTATVDSNGVVKAVANGSTSIKAAVGGKTAAAAVTVAQAVSSVTIAPTSRTFTSFKEAQTFTVAVKDALGNTMDKLLSWASSKAEVATAVSSGAATGLAAAVADGETTITVTAGDKTATAVVTVAQAVNKVTVAPASFTFMSNGETLEFKATAEDALGNLVLGKAITWQSSTAAAATVNASGVVTAVGNGTSTVTATIGGKQGNATIAVTQAVASVSLSPETKTMASIGETFSFTLTVKDSKGNVISGPAVTWTSSNAAFASVTDGAVEAKANGSATITAEVAGKSATAQVIVSQAVDSVEVVIDSGAALTGPDVTTSHVVKPAVYTYALALPGSAIMSPIKLTSLGDTLQFKAIVKDARGNAISGKVVSWNSDKPDNVEVDSGGKATGRRNGPAKISASVESKSGSLDVSVEQAIATIEVEPTSRTFASFGETQPFRATPKDARGNPVEGKTIGWNSSASSVTVDSLGVATAGTADGDATITASVDGKSKGASVKVAQEVATISITPDTKTLSLFGNQQDFVVVARDGRGNLVNKTVEWISSHPALASVNPSGRATALGNGRITITAKIGGKTGTATLIIAQGSARIEVSKGSHQFPALKRVEKILAKFFDVSGAEITKTLTWSSDNEAVATVSASGDITAQGNGTAIITASAEGVSASVAIQVTQTLNGVVITEAGSGKLKAFGHKRKFNAVAVDPDGNPIVGKSASWKSSDDGIASVDGAGEATAKLNGSVTITAIIDDKIAAKTLDVDQEVDRLVSLSGEGKLKALNRTRQYRAIDANGFAIAGKTIAWSSTSDGIATVDGATGTAKAKGNGLAKIRATVDGKSVESDLEVSQEVTSIEVAADGAGKLGALKKQRKFAAKAKDPDGFDIVGKTVSWKTSDTTTASIGSDGTAVAERNGKVTVRATIDGIESLPVDLEIQQVTSSVEITGDNSKVVALNRKRKFTAKAKDENGFEISGKTATWSSTNGDAVPIDALGEVIAKGNGNTTVKATIDGFTQNVALAVDQVVDRLDAPETGKLKALNRTRQFKAVDADGNAILGKTITWGSSSDTIATLDALTGTAKAKGNGSAKVRATVDGKTVEADLEVSQEVTSIDVTADGSGKLGALKKQRKFTAKAKDPDGFEIVGKTVTWKTSDVATATIGADGTAAAEKNGKVTVKASIDGIESQPVDLEIQQVTSSVEIIGDNSKVVALNRKRKFTAKAKDENGFEIADKTATWTSTNGVAAPIDPTGEVTAKGNGNTTVKATIDGVTGSSALSVDQVLSRVEGDGTGKVKALKRTRQFKALDEDGNEIIGKTIEWSSGATGIATVDGTGVASAKGNGTASISAKVDGKTVNSNLEILQEVTSVTVKSVDSGKITAFNKKRKFTVEAKDPDGYVVSESRTTTWSSSNTTIAPIDSLGEVTAKKNGSANVSATFDGVASSTVSLEVSQVISSVVAVDGSGKFKSKGEGRQYVAKDSEGNLIEKPVSWRISGDTAIAEVSLDGKVTSKQNKKTNLTATVDSVSVSVELEVEQVAVRIEITKKKLSLPKIGREAPFEAEAYDALGKLVEDKTIQWSVSNPSVATINALGKLVATGRGSTIVRASLDGAIAEVELTVD